MPYSEIKNILNLHLIRSKAIYVKGVEKIKWLKKYFNNIIEIDAVKTPPLSKMRKWKLSYYVCKHHREPHMIFAAQHVLLLQRYLLVNRRSIERSLEIFYRKKHLSFR